MRLLCIPYAGGSGSVFYEMSRYLNKEIELISIELPGRGKRFCEKGISSFQEAIAEINRLISIYSKEDVYLFGYSYGSMLALEAVRRKYIHPKHLFLAALEPPQKCNYRNDYHELSDEEMLNDLIKNGGIAIENEEERKYLQYFVPLLRADFSAVADYCFEEKYGNVNCDTTILYADKDVSSDKITDWKNIITKPCDIKMFQGNHFFIRNYYKEIAEVINKVYMK